MPTINEYLEQEILLEQYKGLRNAPRDTIRDRLVRVAEECLQQYDDLQIALTGGSETIPDISALAEQFATVTGPVTPFIQLLQATMRVIIATPKIVDQAAAAQGMSVAPFGVDISTPIEPSEYAALLAAAAQAIQTTAAAAQALTGDE